MTQQDLFALIEEAPLKREPRSFPVPVKAGCIRPAHHVVKLPGDEDYWCSFCGARGLPAPPPRKEWE